MLVMTLAGLWVVYKHPERLSTITMQTKYLAVDFDHMMNSCIPFQYFFDFIEKKKPTHLVYIHLFVLIRLHDQSKDELVSD